MPQPYRDLLVHKSDMTPTLERFWGKTFELHQFDAMDEGESHYRLVTLNIEPDGEAVEFGAIRIDLSLFSARVRERITAHYTPLGAILRDHGIEHTSGPRGFFAVQSFGLIDEAFRLEGPERLYGRKNVLLDDAGRTLADVVEVLPPCSGVWENDA